MKRLLHILCCCFVVIVVTARNPGLKARITSKGLNYANSQAIKSLQTSIKKTAIPDQSGHAAGFDYKIYNMHVSQFNLPSSSIDLVPGQGLAWRASGAFIEIDGNWKYKGWLLRDSGTFSGKISDVAFDIVLVISSDSTGKPRISAGHCSASVGDVDFHLKGGASWLYNLFSGDIGNKIKDKLNEQLCPMIAKAVNVDAEKKMKDLPMTTPLARKFLLDYRLIAKPLFNTQFMETYHKGEVFWRANNSTGAPMTAPPIPDSGDTQNMLYLWISDYVLDTFMYQAQTHGYLVRNVTAKDLPTDKRGVLNTTCSGLVPCIGKLISEVGKKYPNSTVELRMTSSRVPDLRISTSGVLANFSGNIDLYARVPGRKDAPFLIRLLATMSAKLDISVRNQMLYANISDVNMKLKSGKSDVGPVDDKFVNVLINEALKVFIIPKLNEAGQHGFPLPVTKEITFVNTKIAFLQNILEISTDLKYTPTRSIEIRPEAGITLDKPAQDLSFNLQKLGPLKFRPYIRENINSNESQ